MTGYFRDDRSALRSDPRRSRGSGNSTGSGRNSILPRPCRSGCTRASSGSSARIPPSCAIPSSIRTGPRTSRSPAGEDRTARGNLPRESAEERRQRARAAGDQGAFRDRRGEHPGAWSRQRAAAEPVHLNVLERVRGARVSASAHAGGTRRPARVLPRVARRERPRSRGGHARLHRPASLMSPHFCFRIDLVEAAEAGNIERRRSVCFEVREATHSARRRENRPPLNAGRAPLSDYALASRLSYFLWSSMPDEELLAHAARAICTGPRCSQPRRGGCSRTRALRNLRHRVRRELARFPPLRRTQQRRSRTLSRRSTTNCARRCSRSRSDSSSISSQEDRSVLDFLYADYTFVNATAGEALRHLRHRQRIRSSGSALERADRIRPRRAVADGGLPHGEFSGPAHQPGEARLLGRPPRPRRTHSAAAGRRPRVAERRRPARRPDVARSAGETSRRSNPARAAMRVSIPSAWSSKATARSASGAQPTSAVVPSIPAPNFPDGTRRRRPRRADADYIREHREDDFVDNLCRKLLAYALGRTLFLSDESLDRRNDAPSSRRTIIASAA